MEHVTFGQALALIRQGSRATRSGWNGTGMYIYYVPASVYPAATDVAKAEFVDNVPYRAYIAMRTAAGDVVPWVASQSDLLEDDWYLV